MSKKDDDRARRDAANAAEVKRKQVAHYKALAAAAQDAKDMKRKGK